MTLSALDDPSHVPSDELVASVLGKAIKPWAVLSAWLSEEIGIDLFEWATAGKQYGWSLRAKKKKRTIVYLIPQHGSFLIGLVLGDRAVAASHAVPLTASVRETIAGAKKYAEGTGFRLPVATMSDLDDVKTLVTIKNEH